MILRVILQGLAAGAATFLGASLLAYPIWRLLGGALRAIAPGALRELTAGLVSFAGLLIVAPIVALGIGKLSNAPIRWVVFLQLFVAVAMVMGIERLAAAHPIVQDGFLLAGRAAMIALVAFVSVRIGGRARR